MWAKLSHTLKPGQAHDDDSGANSHGEVLAGVLEHPNLSVFHRGPENPAIPPSPSNRRRVGMFKRHAKRYDESQRAPSLMKLPFGIPKKFIAIFATEGNASQISAGPSSSAGAERGRVSSHDIPSSLVSRPEAKRSSSFNRLKRPAKTTRSPSRAKESRPSEHDQMRDPATPLEPKSVSVRSILHDGNTSGVGQNVHFSRDPDRVSSPDRTMDTEYQSVMTHAVPNTTPAPPEEVFLERLQCSGSTDSNASSFKPPFASTSKSNKSKHSGSGIFSPMGSPEDTSASQVPKSDSSDSQLLFQLPPLPAPDFTVFFDDSQDLDLPILPQPGRGLEVEMSLIEIETEGKGGANAMTAMPYRDKDKGKEREVDVPKENLAPTGVDGTIFTAKEKSLRRPSALHDFSNSSDLGPTLFNSMLPDDLKRSSTYSVLRADDPSYPSSARSPMSAEDAAPPSRASFPGIKGRSRVLNDTVSMSMLRSYSPKPLLPEADINGESSLDLVVYSAAKAEPDPFCANANTYSTPQTNIPVTPPRGDSAAREAAHVRRASNQEDLIFSLKAQLVLQMERCGKSETDLRARDELVEVLGKKLSEVEREEAKKRSVLKQWKKKVVELERACQYLEEEVEGSRQESMERSILDEASSEALRFLHRQIAGLEHEKESSKRREEMLRAEVGTLEALLREKSDDVMRLKETLWSRDESERELEAGIQESKLIDGNELKNELKNMTVAKDQRSEEEHDRHREAELEWEEEKEGLLTAVENAKLENARLVAELDNYKQQLKEHDDELSTLKSELEARCDHSKKGADELEAIEAAKCTTEEERDALQAKVNELEDKMMEMEAEYVDSEIKQVELENDIQELWDVKEALEKDREEILNQDKLKNELKNMTMAKDQRNEEERERHREAELEWEEEKENLSAAVENAKLENARLVAELDNCKQHLKEHDDELSTLKSELEARYDHSKKGAEELEAVEAAKRTAEEERDTLQAKVNELDDRMMEMEAGYVESEKNQVDLENDVQELWDVKEALEKDREELLEQIRNQDGDVHALRQTLQGREDRIVELSQERQYALDNVARLEENIRRRDAEAAEYSQRNLAREAEAEALREQMSRMNREHASALEAVAAAQTAEAEKQTRAAKERAGDLENEIERLRRQINALKQESADKEVKIVQITKQRAQDKEDLQGLNIALDSKQQELDLLKRLVSRGTAGPAPAQPSKIGHQRRNSAVFNTPSLGSHPPSVLSDAGTDGGSASGVKMAALGRRSCLSSGSAHSSTLKPAPRAQGSMGPPAPVTKLRASVAGTPTPEARPGHVHPRSVSATLAVPGPKPWPMVSRRVVSAMLGPTTCVDASPAPSEKEIV